MRERSLSERDCIERDVSVGDAYIVYDRRTICCM